MVEFYEWLAGVNFEYNIGWNRYGQFNDGNRKIYKFELWEKFRHNEQALEAITKRNYRLYSFIRHERNRVVV